MQYPIPKCLRMALAILLSGIVTISALTTNTASVTADAAPTFEQEIYNNMRQDGNRQLAKGMQRANPGNRAEQPLHLSAFSHSDDDARATILEKFPIGTSSAQILAQFPHSFVLFALRIDELNGTWVEVETSADGKGNKQKMIGTRSLVLTIDKYYPIGIAPVIQYRFAHLAFDAAGKLLEIRVASATDAI